MEYKFKFTVIMPIYNVEKYLEESILSVINQDIGLNSIQLILVNDGSNDGSGDICLKYADLYPDNIVYLKQENSGVSAARNLGMEHIKGKYVNFLDPDDLWPSNTFTKVYDKFSIWGDKVDIIAGRIKLFGAQNGYHMLDYKFKKDQVIDIFEHYDFIQLSCPTTFIKEEALRNSRFDTRLKFAEDSKFMTPIILEKQKYGIMGSIEYQYRKRDDNSSALQTSGESKQWYFDTVKFALNYVKDYSIQKFGRVIPYIQFYIMYDLQWRIKGQVSEQLTEEELKEYKNSIIELIKYIDDDIIMEQRHLWREHKVLAMCLKYNKDIRKDFLYKRGSFLFNNIEIDKVTNKNKLVIEILEVSNNNLVLEGYSNFLLPEDTYDIYFETNTGEYFEVEKIKRNKYSTAFNEVFYEVIGFRVEIPLSKIKSITPKINYQKHNKSVRIDFGKFSKISKLGNSYYVNGNIIIKHQKNKIIISKRTNKSHIKNELRFQKLLFSRKEYNIMFFRFMYIFMKKFINIFNSNKEIWLLSDRIMVANDNAEHLFKYIVEQKDKKIKPYFVISKNSPDYNKMKEIGKVIDHDSFKYRLYFLLSSKLISSHADEFVINAFGNKKKYVKDLYKFNFIFLQHGITKEDISGWLNKYSKNIKLFVTAGKEEYKSILNYDFYYSKDEVKLTGFPRYDNLMNDSSKKEKTLLIIPTWRKYLAGPLNEKKQRTYNPYFKESGYFEFYNGLINDPKLLKVLEKYNYKGKFCLHPAISVQIEDFKDNELIQLERKPVDYQEEFKKNSIMVTDYSSVFFDFAYLKKPIIYAHFDEKEFYQSHLYQEGYFSYERDGFGPVYYDYESTLNGIIETIENGCKMKEEYVNRVENFYFKFDTNNCKRVYEEILKLD